MTTAQITAPPRVPGRFRPVLELRRNVLQANERWWREYGDVFRMVLGPPGADRELWMTSHPDAAARVLGGSTWRNFSKGEPVYEEIRYWIGDGLLTAEGEDWTRQKRLLQPLFTKAAVDGYAGLMVEEVERSIADWSGGSSPATVDLGARMLHLTAHVVVRTLFGDAAEDAIPKMRDAFPPVSDAVIRRGLGGVRLPVSIPTPLVRRARAGQATLYAVCDEIITHRRRGQTSGDADLLGRLLAARDGGSGLGDSEIRDQILVFLLAGHETTSTALTFALHLLGRHPEIQEAVRAEAWASGESAPTASDAHRMVLTQAVLKETMRLYPSAPIFGRLAVGEDELLGHAVRPGVGVAVSAWNIHRRADLWPDPLRFDPTRFLPETEAREQRNRYAWIPFGAGPRACIGQHFSMIEATLALALILRRYAVESLAPADHVPVSAAITLFPVEPVLARVRRL